MQTKKVNVVEDYHGTPVADPYRWLEDSGDPEVQVWVERQNALTEAFLQGEDPRPAIKARLQELWNYPRTQLPRRAGSWIFFEKNSGLQNQPVLYRQRGLSGEPKMVLDPNSWSPDGTVAMSNYSVEEGGRFVAYTVSVHGSDRQEIRIRDLEKGEDLPEVLRWCRFTNMAWFRDLGFYYTRYPAPGTVDPGDKSNFNQVYWHALGTDQEEDVLIFELPERKELSFHVSLTWDQQYLLLHVFEGTDRRNGLYYRPLGGEPGFVHLFEPGEASYRFLGSHGSTFYLVTNLEAPRGRIIAVDLKNPGREQWVEILPEQEDVIDQACYISGCFVVSFLHNAHSRLSIYDQSGRYLKDVQLPTMGSVQGLWGRQDEKEFFLSFTSFLHPAAAYHYEFPSGQLKPFGELKLTFDPADYETKQVFYPSKDGTQVSMFLVHKRGLKLDGQNPNLLYGYGGFNIAITPSFSPGRLWWLEQGGVYAVANLRGGSEYGEEWHRAGMLENKQNVFDDFIAAAEWLIENKYTSREKLVIEGRSNGGLLVSAVLVQRPELFGAVVCVVPVTDMLRFHKFTVGRYWVPEYGNAETNPEHFQFLYRYSPLHNAAPGEYPPTIIVTADGDDRVVPAHAYKFRAALQGAQRGAAPILLRVDTKAGHGHGKPTAKIVEEQADIYGFLVKVLGN
ncbi:MAG TPA: prolyl oligopeptidase family serine peptidase [Limnochordia bacterium]|nr:prolyl oligopeptidase family serine peptidase [Limnochordia bacterium]